jgi:hypothetical protein
MHFSRGGGAGPKDRHPNPQEAGLDPTSYHFSNAQDPLLEYLAQQRVPIGATTGSQMTLQKLSALDRATKPV